MTTTLTQMARAHYEAMTRVDIHPLTPWAKWDELPESAIAEKLANMRAALEALREPSEGMVEAAVYDVSTSQPEDGGDMHRQTTRDAFTAMIDHALNEKGKEDG